MLLLEKKKGEVCVLECSGKLDALSSPQFEQKILSMLQNGDKKISLDFKGVSYLSSAGMRVLVKASQRAKELKATIEFTNLTEPVREILQMTGFLNFLNIK